MRLGKKRLAVLTLAGALTRNFEGLTSTRWRRWSGPSGGPTERMRDAVEAAFGPLDRDRGRARSEVPALPRAASAISPPPRPGRPLSGLENAARALEAAGNAQPRREPAHAGA